MKLAWKIISVSCIGLLLFLFLLSGILIYYAANPSSLKALIEKSISRTTGNSLTFQEIDYTLDPMRVRAEGILFGPREDLTGFSVRVSHVSADIRFDGPFGRKILNISKLKINGFSFQATEDIRLPDIDRTPRPQSFVGNIIRRIISFFLFKEIRLLSAEVGNGEVKAKIKDQIYLVRNIEGFMAPEDHVKFTCSSEYEWPSKKMSFQGPELHLVMNSAVSLADPEISCHLSLKKATYVSPSVDADNINLEADLHYTHSKRQVAVELFDLFVGGVSPKLETADTIPLHIIIREAVLDLLNHELDSPNLDLKLDDIVQMNGALDVQFGKSSRVSMEIRDGRFFLDRLMPFVGGNIKEQLAPISLSGPISFKGKISGRQAQGTWDWQCDINSRLDQNHFKYARGNTQIRGGLSGGIDLKAKYPQIEASAKIEIDGTDVTDGNITLPSSSLKASLSGKQPFFEIEDLSAEIPLAEFDVGGKNTFIKDIRLNLQKGKMDMEKEMILFPEIRMESALLKNIILFLSVDKGHLLVELNGKQTDLMRSAETLGLLPRDWQFGALDAIHMKIRQNENGIFSVTSHLELDALRFQNPDSSCVGENLSVHTGINGQIDLRKDSIDLRAELQIKKGEVLYDRFYLNMAENGFIALSNTMRYDISKTSFQMPDLTLALNNILEVKMKGSLIHSDQKQHLQCNVRLPGTDLKPIYRHFVLEPFQMENPGLKALELAGMISADLEFTGKGPDIMATGYLHWDHGKLSTGEGGPALEGVHLVFPIWYQTEKNNRSREPLKGKLSVDTVIVPSMLNQPLTLDLDADDERLLISTPIVFSIPGGDIEVGPISARNIFSSQPSFETALKLGDFDINPLLSKIWSKPVKGAINGKLEPLVLEGSTLTSSGNFELTIFDGKITLADLGAEGIFTAAPVFKLDAFIEDLSLAEITAGTSFGKIDGILKGYVKNLEIAYGQPQRFNLLLETHEKKGVSQKVSLKAVDNIARIGGTQSPFMGMAGRFASFFEEFQYKKIGIRASLRNDVFRINGTIKEDGTEYIMQRGGLPGVSIVNHNPDNRVSFKDMIKRIKRIKSSKGKKAVNY